MRSVHTFLFACLYLAFGLVATGEFGDLSGFLENEQLEEVQLDGGMLWQRVTGAHEGVPQVIHAVTVDLSQPNLNLKLLRGARLAVEPNQYHTRSTVSQLLEDSGTSLAINASFFDIGATQTPYGLAIDAQELLRTAANNRTVLLCTTDKELLIGDFTSVVLCKHGGAAPIINSVNGDSIGDNSLHLYRQPWVRSPGNRSPVSGGRPLTEVILTASRAELMGSASGLMGMHCTVREIRDELESVDIAPEEVVLAATGSMRDFLKGMSSGEEVSILWRIGGSGLIDGTGSIQLAVAGSARLLINGGTTAANNAHWNNRHPRSAIGVSEDRQRMVFVLVEGRMPDRAEGMSLHSVADLLVHLGAYQGLELDGGGSSALAGRLNGNGRLLSVPSGGSERYVPIGLGILETANSSYQYFRDVSYSASDREAIVSWTTPDELVSYAAWGEDFNALPHPAAPSGKRHVVQFRITPEMSTDPRLRLVANLGAEVIVSPWISAVKKDSSDDSYPPQWWMRHYFGQEAVDASADWDADGFSNLEEYHWGSDPTSPSAQPNVSFYSDPTREGEVHFTPVIHGKSYRLWTYDFNQSIFVVDQSGIPDLNQEGGAFFSINGVFPKTLVRVEPLPIP
jgi:hypothetical protein